LLQWRLKIHFACEPKKPLLHYFVYVILVSITSITRNFLLYWHSRPQNVLVIYNHNTPLVQISELCTLLNNTELITEATASISKDMNDNLANTNSSTSNQSICQRSLGELSVYFLRAATLSYVELITFSKLIMVYMLAFRMLLRGNHDLYNLKLVLFRIASESKQVPLIEVCLENDFVLNLNLSRLVTLLVVPDVCVYSMNWLLFNLSIMMSTFLFFVTDWTRSISSNLCGNQSNSNTLRVLVQQSPVDPNWRVHPNPFLLFCN
jgi:hypothetical protein